MHRLNGADPHNYDVVLDSHSLGLEIAAEVLVRAVEAGRPPSSGLPATWTVPPLDQPPRPSSEPDSLDRTA